MAELLFQKVQQTFDVHITLHFLLKHGKAAVLLDCLAAPHSLQILRVLADIPQMSRQLGSLLRHLVHVAAEEGEPVSGGGLLLRPDQLRGVQDGEAGDVVGKQPGCILMETDLVRWCSYFYGTFHSSTFLHPLAG